MAEVKWIKISTNIFDDEAIELIEQMPEGDAIIVIWFKLLAKAGKTNNGGLIYFKDNIPYTEEMLSTVFKKPLNIIRMALKVFEQFGMIEITSSNEILITNWEKHQNIDGLEKIREYNRLAKRKERERKKLLLGDNSKMSLTSQGQFNDCQDTDIDKDIDIEEEKDIIDIELENNSLSEDKSSEPTPEKTPKGIGLKEVKEFVDLYNSIAVRLPKVQKISSNREKKIKARLKNIDLNGWKQVFERCEKSDFCCGVNKNNWTASLDWLISNDNNYVKVLEGRYDNKYDMRSGRNSIEDDKFSELQRKGMEIL